MRDARPTSRQGAAVTPGANTARASLSTLPETMLAELARARRGLVVLAVDGLSHAAARAGGWAGTDLTGLDSTFPSTSTTGWLTALTGVGPGRHGVPGMVYRVPGRGELVYAVTGQVLARGSADAGADPRLVVPHPTVFDRASEVGVNCVALPREIGWLPGPWARALLHGARVVRGPDGGALAGQAADPPRQAAVACAQVDRVLDEVQAGEKTLLWVYLNLDDHVHRHGYDEAALAAVASLGEYAERWCARGWTVLGHADHGQVPSRPDPELCRAWSGVDNPVDCHLPGGGAGRVRWLYPRAGREEAVRDRLAAALGDAAVVLTPARLRALWLAPESGPGAGGCPGAEAGGVLRGRVGVVVALARDDRFPIPDAALGWEHGGIDEAERVVPLATWRSC
jgi:hypothetical protein